MGLLFVTLLSSERLSAQDQWEVADNATIRLPPARIASLPVRLRTELERRRCTIPQSPFATPAPENAVLGHFLTPTSRDWAVLCSVDRVSTILVFVSERADSVIAIESRPDRDFLQTISDGKIGFSRAITAVPASRMLRYLGRACPGALLHAGIDDAFVEKASTVLYWCKGKWLRLAGAD